MSENPYDNIFTAAAIKNQDFGKPICDKFK